MLMCSRGSGACEGLKFKPGMGGNGLNLYVPVGICRRIPGDNPVSHSPEGKVMSERNSMSTQKGTGGKGLQTG